MSLCVSFKVGNDIIVAVDSRASFTYEGVTYCTKEDTPKYIVHTGKLLVTFGKGDITDKFREYCTEHPDETDIEKMFDTVTTPKRIEQYNADIADDLLLAVYSFNIEQSQVNCIYWSKDGKGKLSSAIKDYSCFGMNETYHDKVENAIQSYVRNNTTNGADIFQLLTEIFDSVNDEQVGGIWRLFKLSKSSTELLATYTATQEGVRYAPEWLAQQCEYDTTHNMTIYAPEIFGGSVTGGDVVGGEFWNLDKTTKLVMGMAGNLGDMKIVRDTDGTVVLQIYDDMTVTTLRRDNVGFLSTSGNTTYPLHTWDFKDAEVKNLKAVAVFG